MEVKMRMQVEYKRRLDGILLPGEWEGSALEVKMRMHIGRASILFIQLGL